VARKKEPWVSDVRPRRVDAAAVEHERKEWEKFNAEQTVAEANLDDDQTWPDPP